MKKSESSWDPYAKWYDSLVGEKGHYFHKEVILPYLETVFPKKDNNFSLLDLGCGQGFLAGMIPKQARYVGVDIGKELIKKGKEHHPKRKFYVRNLAEELELEEEPFSHAIFLLSLQNIPDLARAIKNGSKYLAPRGKLILVINHPCFRIPRQTSWGYDEGKKMQYRRIDRYQSSMEIPIQMHPGAKEASGASISFHHPLSSYFSALEKAKLKTLSLEELYSAKTSQGKRAKEENRARREFPYFLVIVAES